MAARVIGIGQPSAGDDGVGLVVLEALRSASLPAGTELHAVAEPSGILPLLAGADPLVLVDAVLGGVPGGVLCLDESALAGGEAVPLSTHGVGVAQVLALGRALDAEAFPRRLVLVGVSIAAPARGAMGLSAAVSGAVPRAMTEVQRILGGRSCTNPRSPDRS